MTVSHLYYYTANSVFLCRMLNERSLGPLHPTSHQSIFHYSVSQKIVTFIQPSRHGDMSD